MPNKPAETIDALIFAAVSDNEQAEPEKFSLDAQIADSKAIAEKNGWRVIDIIRIEGHSRDYRTLAQLAAAARANQEPGFDRLITHLEKRDFQIFICRDANRFARQGSLLYEITSTIIEDVKARIYSLSDGMVDKSNVDIWLMVKGYEITKQMRWIKQELVRGRYKLVDEQGLPQGGSYVWSHMKVRDEYGKVLAFVPDPSKKSVIEAAAQLIVDRVSWRTLETQLFEMGFALNGQPYRKHFFYHMFNNPWFWGDAVRNWKNQNAPTQQKIGLWVVDHSAPVPEGVVIRRDVNPPALTGELAGKLRAELIRRITFRPRRHDSVHVFSGLLVCERCGFMMVFSPHRTGDSYNCQSKYSARLRPGCERKWSISERKVKLWMSKALELMLTEHNPYGFIAIEPQHIDHTLDNLNTELSMLEKQIRRLIEKQAAAPDSLANLYDDQINALGQQRENLIRHIADEEQKTKQYNLADIQAAFHELTAYETLEAFWQAPSGTINQLLHRLLGGRRLTILNSQVTGSIAWK